MIRLVKPMRVPAPPMVRAQCGSRIDTYRNRTEQSLIWLGSVVFLTGLVQPLIARFEIARNRDHAVRPGVVQTGMLLAATRSIRRLEIGRARLRGGS